MRYEFYWWEIRIGLVSFAHMFWRWQLWAHFGITQIVLFIFVCGFELCFYPVPRFALLVFYVATPFFSFIQWPALPVFYVFRLLLVLFSLFFRAEPDVFVWTFLCFILFVVIFLVRAFNSLFSTTLYLAKTSFSFLQLALQ